MRALAILGIIVMLGGCTVSYRDSRLAEIVGWQQNIINYQTKEIRRLEQENWSCK